MSNASAYHGTAVTGDNDPQSPVARRYVQGEIAQAHGYSNAVVTTGGTTVWLAGHGALTDASGKSIAGDIDAQTREIFRLLEKTLSTVGGKLADIVTMTVFINDARLGARFKEIRREVFGGDKCPASALLTIAAFAAPGVVVEVQGIAVVGQQ